MTLSKISIFILLAALVGLIHGHYIITSPATRGFTEEEEPTPPCGGYDTVQTPRLSVNIGETFEVDFTIEDEHGTFVVSYSSSSSPASLADFTATGQELAVQSEDTENTGSYKVEIQTNTLTVSDGSVGTFQFIYESVFDNDTFDSNFYQCVDVIFHKTNTNDQNMPLVSLFSIVLAVAMLFLLF